MLHLKQYTCNVIHELSKQKPNFKHATELKEAIDIGIVDTILNKMSEYSENLPRLSKFIIA